MLKGGGRATPRAPHHEVRCPPSVLRAAGGRERSGTDRTLQPGPELPQGPDWGGEDGGLKVALEKTVQWGEVG